MRRMSPRGWNIATTAAPVPPARFDGVLRQCRVSTQHCGEAVFVLLGNPETVATEH